MKYKTFAKMKKEFNFYISDDKKKIIYNFDMLKAEGVPIFALMAYPQKEYTSKEWQRIAFYLLTCGYCKENFEVDTNGVDPKWIEKIKEYI